jgi:hypothetical protein
MFRSIFRAKSELSLTIELLFYKNMDQNESRIHPKYLNRVGMLSVTNKNMPNLRKPNQSTTLKTYICHPAYPAYPSKMPF